jgi:uncharacterized Fe-S cluster-containing MiaB family protein
MEYLIYISTAKKLLNEQELTEILTVSRKNNQNSHLTGVLLYSEGTFIQLLEGEPEALSAIYDKIKKDPRHKNLIKLAEAPIEERSFPDWTMGFRTINAVELESFEGYFNLNKKVFDNNDNHPGISIIKTFAESHQELYFENIKH